MWSNTSSRTISVMPWSTRDRTERKGPGWTCWNARLGRHRCWSSRWYSVRLRWLAASSSVNPSTSISWRISMRLRTADRRMGDPIRLGLRSVDDSS